MPEPMYLDDFAFTAARVEAAAVTNIAFGLDVNVDSMNARAFAVEGSAVLLREPGRGLPSA